MVTWPWRRACKEQLIHVRLQPDDQQVHRRAELPQVRVVQHKVCIGVLVACRLYLHI